VQQEAVGNEFVGKEVVRKFCWREVECTGDGGQMGLYRILRGPGGLRECNLRRQAAAYRRVLEALKYT
jgi:hypothetical protein